MTLAEFLAQIEAQYGRSGTTEDVLNIPIDQAQQYLDLAVQQYGNVGAIDWTPLRTSDYSVDANQAWLERNGVRITPMQTVFQDENGMVTSWAGVDLNRNRGTMGRFRDPTTGKYYHIVGEYDAQGNLVPGSAGVYEYNPHSGGFFSAIAPAVRTIGGAMLGAYGLSQLAPAAGAAGAAQGGAGAATGAPGLGGMAGQGISVAPAQGGLSAGLGTAGANAGLGINVAPAVGGLGSGLGTVGAGAGGLGLSVTPGALAAFDAATGLSALAPQVAQAAQTSVLGQGGKVLDRNPSVLDRMRQIGGVVGDLAPVAGLAGLGAGAATVQPPVQPQAPTVPGAEAPPEARGYQAARDPIIDVLNRNRRQGRNRTMLTGYGGVPMESVRTGGNTLLGL